MIDVLIKGGNLDLETCIQEECHWSYAAQAKELSKIEDRPGTHLFLVPSERA